MARKSNLSMSDSYSARDATGYSLERNECKYNDTQHGEDSGASSKPNDSINTREVTNEHLENSEFYLNTKQRHKAT